MGERLTEPDINGVGGGEEVWTWRVESVSDETTRKSSSIPRIMSKVKQGWPELSSQRSRRQE